MPQINELESHNNCFSFVTTVFENHLLSRHVLVIIRYFIQLISLLKFKTVYFYKLERDITKLRY